MQAGRLRHKITVESLVAGSPQQSASGEPNEEWTALLSSIWASVEPLQGRELFAAQEHHSEIEVRVRIRYRSTVTAKMRVVFESKYYEILAVVDPENLHRELELMCRQGVLDADAR